MASFLETKKVLKEILGLEAEVDEDSDIVLKCSSTSEECEELIFPNDALKKAFDNIGNYTQDKLEILTGNYREVALQLSGMASRYAMGFELNDDINGISYSVGPASLDYCMFLLNSIADGGGIQSRRRHIDFQYRRRPIYRHGVFDEYRDNPFNFLSELLRIITLRIYSKSQLSAKQLRDYAISFEFLIMYKRCTSISEYTDSQDIFSMGNFVPRYAREELDSPPQRVYNADVIEYYAMAMESRDPFTVYISFYHIIEYYFDAIFRKKLTQDIQNKMTRPDFSYKNEEKIYELAKYIKKHMSSDDESGRGNEFESLKYVLMEYVPVEELKNRINQMDPKAINYYQNNFVPFTSSKKTKIAWFDTQGVYANLATRIYETRNSLVHSKSEQATSQYKPYKNKKELTEELTLIRAVAEIILINSSKMI